MPKVQCWSSGWAAVAWIITACQSDPSKCPCPHTPKTEGTIAFLCNGLVSAVGRSCIGFCISRCTVDFPMKWQTLPRFWNQVLASSVCVGFSSCHMLVRLALDSPLVSLWLYCAIPKKYPDSAGLGGEKLHWNPRWRVVAWDLTQNRTWRLFYVLEFMLSREDTHLDQT